MAEKEMKVTFLSWTDNPGAVITQGLQMCSGNVYHDLNDIPKELIEESVEAMTKSTLNGVFEHVNVTMLIENIPVPLATQFTRHRVGFSFSQVSGRYLDLTKEELIDNVYRGESIKSSEQIKLWNEAIESAQEYYKKLVEAGVDLQDARGALPQNVLTSLCVHTNLRALKDLAGARLCRQSQIWWNKLMAMIKDEVRRVWGDAYAEMLQPQCIQKATKDENGNLSGGCLLNSKYDHKCVIRKNVWKEKDSGKWEYNQ